MIYHKSESHSLCLGLSLAEYRCQCEHESCTATIVSPGLIVAYEKFRKRAGVPLFVSCGYRCPFHNYNLPKKRGAALSRHMTGEAIDVGYVGALKEKFSVEEIIDIAQECGFTFIDYYQDKKIFHLDVREKL